MPALSGAVTICCRSPRHWDMRPASPSGWRLRRWSRPSSRYRSGCWWTGSVHAFSAFCSPPGLLRSWAPHGAQSADAWRADPAQTI